MNENLWECLLFYSVLTLCGSRGDLAHRDRVLQLVQHGLNEGLQQRDRTVCWGHAARWGLLIPHRDTVSSNMQNHTGTWGGAQKLSLNPGVLKHITGSHVYLPASLEQMTSTPASWSSLRTALESSFSGPPATQEWLPGQEVHTSLSV